MWIVESCTALVRQQQRRAERQKTMTPRELEWRPSIEERSALRLVLGRTRLCTLDSVLHRKSLSEYKSRVCPQMSVPSNFLLSKHPKCSPGQSIRTPSRDPFSAAWK